MGLIVGVIIGIATDYFTNDNKAPVRYVAMLQKWTSIYILSDCGIWVFKCFPAIIGIAVSALLAYKICEPIGDGYAMFGISMAAVGMLSIVGMIISNDAYGLSR